jgi:4-amino-4-deoxy-L-arabinose transferase-like glycosyltransferase
MDPPSSRPEWPPALLCALLVAFVWSALPGLLLSAPHADNVEQLNWSHSFEWGYFKHPPLPTWLLRAAIELVGRSAFITYALALACVAVTLLIVWRCARLLLDRDAALVALLLTSADYYLMGRGSFLNHNTVMLPFVAASAWAVLRIAQGAGARAWLLLGLVQALGLLTKYQMAVFIAAAGVALLAAGVRRRPGFASGTALCAAATIVPLVPHAMWLLQHRFSTFQYASHSLLADLGIADRIRQLLSFAVQQVGRMAPALAALGAALAIDRARRKDRADDPAAPPADSSVRLERPLWILALMPFAVVLGLCLFAGVAPQNHWGATTTLLMPLAAVVWLRKRRLPAVATAAIAVVGAHAAAVIWNVVVWAAAPGPHHSFAAQALAALAEQHWNAHAAGRIRVVIGPDWEAGSIALNLPSRPMVLTSGDRSQEPWVTDELIDRCGALVVWQSGHEARDQVGAAFAARIAATGHLETDVPRGLISSIEAGVIAPRGDGCR